MKRFLENIVWTLRMRARDRAIKQFERDLSDYRDALVKDGMSDWAAGIAARVNYRGF